MKSRLFADYDEKMGSSDNVDGERSSEKDFGSSLLLLSFRPIRNAHVFELLKSLNSMIVSINNIQASLIAHRDIENY